MLYNLFIYTSLASENVLLHPILYTISIGLWEFII